MTNLSPAAEAVLDAFICCPVEASNQLALAAALRAAADQVVPEPVPSDQRWTDVMAQRCVIRFELLAIAAELEGHQ